jgi:hypothetical protein
MAREAGMKFSPAQFSGVLEAEIDEFSLKAFEAFVRADEQEKYKWDIHSCGPTCKRYACVAMREAVEAEREACAKVCDDRAFQFFSESPFFVEMHGLAAAIRNRGNT